MESRQFEEELYRAVAEEMASGVRKEGLWLKAITESFGHEALARATYVRLRVQSMLDDAAREDARQRAADAALLAAAAAAAAREEGERLARLRNAQERVAEADTAARAEREHHLARLRVNVAIPSLEDSVFTLFAWVLGLFALLVLAFALGL